MKDLVWRALQFATQKHGTTLRKYPNADGTAPYPYIVHPIRVAAMVDPWAKWFSRNSARLCVIALLHDVLEDTNTTYQELESVFGKSVADGVADLTNPSKAHLHLSREKRREMDREHLSQVPQDIQVIKMFDRIDNLNDLRQAPRDFVVEKYLPESRLLLEVLQGADTNVAKLYLAAWERLRRHFETKDAVEYGHGEYSQETGKWQWKEVD